jgi:hypothetical protein
MWNRPVSGVDGGIGMGSLILVVVDMEIGPGRGFGHRLRVGGGVSFGLFPAVTPWG